MSVRLLRIFGGFTSVFGHVSAFVVDSPNASICPTKSPPQNRGESFSLDTRYMFMFKSLKSQIIHLDWINQTFIHQVWTFIPRTLKEQLAVVVHVSVQTRKATSNGILSRVQRTVFSSRAWTIMTVGFCIEVIIRRTLVSNTLNKTNQIPAINWRNKKFNEYNARNWGSLSR